MIHKWNAYTDSYNLKTLIIKNSTDRHTCYITFSQNNNQYNAKSLLFFIHTKEAWQEGVILITKTIILDKKQERKRQQTSRYTNTQRPLKQWLSELTNNRQKRSGKWRTSASSGYQRGCSALVEVLLLLSNH